MFDGIPRWPLVLGVLILIGALGYFQMGPMSVGPTSSTDQVCEVVTRMADRDYPAGDGLVTKFRGRNSDCRAHLVTLNFAVAARGSEAAGLWSELDGQVQQQVCQQSVFKALVGRGWTIRSLYSFNDQSARTIKVSSCPDTGA